uniref:Uncharacterized protein n=1 Tax=Ciona savignyi TaxID=51511 RepID=H2ZAV6_CIOSA
MQLVVCCRSSIFLPLLRCLGSRTACLVYLDVPVNFVPVSSAHFILRFDGYK